MNMVERPGEGLTAGVIGVGSMGRNHARVYSEAPDVTLVGVHDTDAQRARSVADEYACRAMTKSELLASADAVSIAVPTKFHYKVTRDCLEHGLHVLVEKPFVDDIERGRQLAAMARKSDLTLQVGHIERFNPATRVLAGIVSDLEIVGIDIQRLGPPLDRPNEDGVVMDLMIHDLDLLFSLVGSDIQSMSAVARDERHVTVQIRFEDRSIAVLTASRLTQQKIRQLAVTALSCRVNADFIDQTVDIHRRSFPEYVDDNGDFRYRHESVVERPIVKNREPLKAEIASFIESIHEGSEPLVTADDALRVIEVANHIDDIALGSHKEVTIP